MARPVRVNVSFGRVWPDSVVVFAEFGAPIIRDYPALGFKVEVRAEIFSDA
jgi:hypothetical protein